MFLRRAPDDDSARALLRTVASSALTYPDTGITRSPILEAPSVYTFDQYGTELGKGRDVFDRAVAALREFRHYPPSFTRVVTLDDSFEAGTVFGTIATHFGFASIHPCRIVDVIPVTSDAEGARFAFSLGTLPGHIGSGEERFDLYHEASTDIVHYTVNAVSRPANLLSWLGRPFMRRFQLRFQVETCETIRGLV